MATPQSLSNFLSFNKTGYLVYFVFFTEKKHLFFNKLKIMLN